MMSRYSTSAKNFGSTQVAFGFLMDFVSLDLGLITVVGLHGLTYLAHIKRVFVFTLAEVGVSI